MSTKLYSLRKSRHIMKQAYSWYKKKAEKLSREKLLQFETLLESLDQSLLEKDRERASVLSHQVNSFIKANFKRHWWEHILELAIALAIALTLAMVIRQVWFDPYQIPTGSMRPTYQEQDDLLASKTAFGVNIPFYPGHFYFDDNLVKRGGAIIFMADNLPVHDKIANFLYVIPMTKRFIKRMIGKPGDTLYFYGGNIYGIDSDGKPLPQLLEMSKELKLEHIPFLNFDGIYRLGKQNEVLFHQMDLPVARLVDRGYKGFEGQVYNGKEWIKDDPTAAKNPHSQIATYSDLWGIGNFAMARLLTKKQVAQQTELRGIEVADAPLYLELSHTPSLSYPMPDLRSKYGTLMNPFKTIIPLQEKHLKALMESMYTARFAVTNGKALREHEQPSARSQIKFPGVPNGTYQLYFGEGKKVNFGSILSNISQDNPLYNITPENVQKLFNYGLHFDKALTPIKENKNYFPHRYGYYRDGDLYLMGGKIFDKNDSTLKIFVANEKEREENSTSQHPYVAFIDKGAPLNSDGSYDIEKIKTFGIKVPERHYLVLGDNHAMSGDSRVMGFIPEGNLRGTPVRIIWPPGPRWGKPENTPYPFFTGPRIFIWVIATTIGIIWFCLHRRALKRKIFPNSRK